MTEISSKIWFGNVCRKNGFPVTDAQLDKLEQYVGLLLDWNKKINLISRKDEENIWQNHILHSASLMFKLDFPKSMRVVDIGTGGGLPGIPLKILQPDLEITLLDATQKKISAVREILNDLRLSGITTQWGRAEEIGKRAEHRSRFEAVVARAVAPLADLVKWGRPFLCDPVRRQSAKDGERIPVTPSMLIAMKGGELEGEIAEIQSDRRVREVRVVNLVFPESEAVTLNDKKVVLINF